MLKKDSPKICKIGYRVREARKAMSLRQSDLSKMTGLPASHLSDIERGASIPTIPTLVKVGKALNRPLEYFFQENNNRPRSLGTVIHWASIGGQAAAKFAHLVEQKTGGDIKLRIYHHAALGSARDQIEGLVEGGIHIFIDEPLSFEPYAKLCGPVFLPYFFDDRDHYYRFLKSSLFEKEIYQNLLDNGIRLLNPDSNWECGSFELLLSTKPIFSPQDLVGRKFRSYDSEAALALRQELGVESVVVEWAQIYDAFEQGTIDTVLVPAAYFASLRLPEFVRYATVLRYGYTLNLMVAINEREYRKLSSTDQQSLSEAIEGTGIYCSQLANKQTEIDLERLPLDQGIPVIQPDQKAWRTAFKSAIDHICKNGLLTRRQYEALLIDN